MSTQNQKMKDYENLAAEMLRNIYSLTTKDNKIVADFQRDFAREKSLNESRCTRARANNLEEIKRLEKSLQTLLRQNQDEFIGEGKEHSRECPWGSYGWRYGGDSVKIINPAELERCVRKSPEENRDLGTIDFKANKEGIKRRLQEGKDVPGCQLSGANRSFYTLADEVETNKVTQPDEVKK